MNDQEWKLIDRFKEPSSWAVFGTTLGMFGISVPGGLMQALSLIGSGLCLLLGFVLKEAPKAAAEPPAAQVLPSGRPHILPVLLAIAASASLMACTAATIENDAGMVIAQCDRLMPLAAAAMPLPVAGPYIAVGVTAGCGTAEGVAKLAADPSSAQWLAQQGQLLKDALLKAGLKT